MFFLMVQQNVMFFQMTQQNVMISLTDQQIVMFFQVNAFFWRKTDFRPVFRFLAKRKSGHFSVIPAGTGSVVNVGHFFGDPDDPNKFR